MEDFTYDPVRDVFTIYGVEYTAELFRSFGGAPPGSWLRIETRKDGVVTVYVPTPMNQRTFDAIVGKECPPH